MMIWATVSGPGGRGMPRPERYAFACPPQVGDVVSLHDNVDDFEDWTIVRVWHRPLSEGVAALAGTEPRLVVEVEGPIRTRR